MTKERFEKEMHYRNLLHQWEMRFHEPTLISPSVLVNVKMEFVAKYGWEEETRIREEVTACCREEIIQILTIENQRKPAKIETGPVVKMPEKRAIVSYKAKKREEKKHLPYRRHQPAFAWY